MRGPVPLGRRAHDRKAEARPTTVKAVEDPLAFDVRHADALVLDLDAGDTVDGSQTDRHRATAVPAAVVDEVPDCAGEGVAIAGYDDRVGLDAVRPGGARQLVQMNLTAG